MSRLPPLYELLPAIYRLRDRQQGEPLRALLGVIDQELRAIEADIDGLYRNLFIETCDEWVVPYIGDLLRVGGVHVARPQGFSQRAYVANTLAYRRRKGTAAVLEQLARDVTGWPARVVEFFARLATTQHLNHVRLSNVRTPDLRETNHLELLGGPFERAAHTVDVRRIEPGHGRYNIPNLGLFVWRLQSYPVSRGAPRAVSDPPDRRYHFNPLGEPAPLFNHPRLEASIAHLAEEIHLPGPLRRRALYDDLTAHRDAVIRGNGDRSAYLGEEPVLQVFLDDQAASPEEIVICDLGGWEATGWNPPTSRAFQRADLTDFRTRVAVDPVRGRLAILSGVDLPEHLAVSYAYGFSADMGGGPYERRDSLAALTAPISWQVAVGRELEPEGDEQIFVTLTDAVAAWNAQPAGTVGVIAIHDSDSYVESLTGASTIEIPHGSTLLMVAAEWPLVSVPDGPGLQRVIGQLQTVGPRPRPHLRGNLQVRGTATAQRNDPGALLLDGLLLEGDLRVLAGNLGSLHLNHCTVVPGTGQLRAHEANDQLLVRIVACIAGPIELPDRVRHLHVADSIVSSGESSDAEGGALSAPGVSWRSSEAQSWEPPRWRRSSPTTASSPAPPWPNGDKPAACASASCRRDHAPHAATAVSQILPSSRPPCRNER